MTQQAPPAALRSSRTRTGAVKAGNPTPQHAIMELKQRIWGALAKLADRDTQQIAVEELDKIVEFLSPDCVPVCLSCLYDSEMQQKSVVKKECVRLFGSLASRHGDLIIPHLSKVIGSILRRLRDPDSSVWDACVDAMGILSSHTIPLSSSSPTQGNGAKSSSMSSSALTLDAFSKPLLDALSEQNKSVQTGAAMCLARVIESARDPPLGAMSRLCPRICKLMNNPNFVARPALLSVIRGLSEIGALEQGQLKMVMPCIHEALKSSDWATRKAAAEALGRISINSWNMLVSFRQLTLDNLESIRFDKVKPVKDSILDSIQLWKSLPGSQIENLGSDSKQDSPDVNLAMEKEVSQTLSPTASEKSLGPGESPRNGNKREVMTDVRPSRKLKFSSDKPIGSVKKRAPSIRDKKVNPEFFEKLSARNTDDCEIEVAMPRKSPPLIAESPLMDAETSDSEAVAAQILTNGSLSSEEHLFPGREMYSTGTGIVCNDEWEALDKHNDGSPMLRDQIRQNFVMTQGETSDILLPGKDADDPDQEVYGWSWNLPKVNGLQRNEILNEAVTLKSLRRKLSQLGQQQSSLLQFVQDFISSTQETMFALQGRVRLLEKVVVELTCESDMPAGWKSDAPAAHEMSGIVAPPGNILRSNLGNFWGKSEPVSKQLNRRASPAPKSNKASAEAASEDWNDFTCGNLRGRLASLSVLDSGLHYQQRNNHEAGDMARLGSEDLGVEQTITRRAWDKIAQSGLERHGEGPSARSVWQASKDEATLAAIRVAGEEREASEGDALSNQMSRLGSQRALQSKGQWSLWGSILELVLSSDMESAYTEVLSTDDVMMLVRLMSRTGPVFDQLTDNTANELLHTVAHLLRQQKYFEICFAWIQQVADLVVSDGMDFSENVKKELLLSLQERVATSMIADSSGTSLEQLLQLLMDAWSVDGEVSRTQL
ncbi:hypothetical protein GOP47_0005710 [Adiantum capillus-veneris]|uniref:TOG domain-containing protein n=1 Tax=Adiantum capillus-veneris TaxID=13818 RepID=A0A9D4ZLA1_ADICA|nr:hypothetical protein GOP47_0005123 [Adiantum capillus-veneris]KAI5080231.1 hypothetical protein GOP47_0005710 [Adiantum capillus-veneris]